jgi:hypothetical protein
VSLWLGGTGEVALEAPKGGPLAERELCSSLGYSKVNREEEEGRRRGGGEGRGRGERESEEREEREDREEREERDEGEERDERRERRGRGRKRRRGRKREEEGESNAQVHGGTRCLIFVRRHNEVVNMLLDDGRSDALVALRWSKTLSSLSYFRYSALPHPPPRPS